MEVGKIAKSDDTRINDEITASPCRLIAVDASQPALFPIRDPRRAPADDQYLAGVVPVPGAEAISVQGREDLAVAGGFCALFHRRHRQAG